MLAAVENEPVRQGVNVAGQVVGGIALATGGVEIIIAASEYISRRPFEGTLVAALGLVTLKYGEPFFDKSMEQTTEVNKASMTSGRHQIPAYDYAWVEGIGWVPQQPYDSTDPVA